ncbi:uncharacterized protein K02A2.6-like [Ornithodoros turicata]|uniref:uncharacterized protein K02A2.6-like n=1 Tax=Ornithodoros turicata TaxID=34597 RepID=UPI0031399F8B
MPSHQPFFRVQEELTVFQDLLIRGDRIVVPPAFTGHLIQLAHESHPGIVRTKQRLREKYWWPQMDKQVENAVKSFNICQDADKSAKTADTPLQPIQFPSRSWEKAAVDIMGPFEKAPPDCRYAIVIVDYFSKWPEAKFCANVTASTILDFLRSVCAREGYPDNLVSDHRPQFISHQFELFLRDRATFLEGRPLRQTVTEYLGLYRCTPHATTGRSPAELHDRNPRTRLDVIWIPSFLLGDDPAAAMINLRERMRKHQQQSKTYTDHKRSAKAPKYKVGDYVRVRKPGFTLKGMPSFTKPFKIIRQKGRYSFQLADGNTWNASKFAPVGIQRASSNPTPSTEFFMLDYPTYITSGMNASDVPVSHSQHDANQEAAPQAYPPATGIGAPTDVPGAGSRLPPNEGAGQQRGLLPPRHRRPPK